MSDQATPVHPPVLSGPPDRRRAARLIGLNVALLLALVVITLASRAGAQPGGASGTRGRGEYTMVSGRVQGATTHTIYIVDGANQEVLALGWNRNANQSEVIGFRSIVDDARYLQRPR